MIVSDFVPAVFLAATGKQATFTTGSTKWLKILALANIEIDNWQNEPNIDWYSLYSPDYSLGTVTATDRFTVPSAVRTISNQEGDVVRIIHSDGTTFTDYDIIDPDMQKYYANGQRTFQDNYVQVVGGNSLRFNRAFTSDDPQYGGTIYAPVYLYAGPGTQPNFLKNDSDVIPVDIPNYLVFATAAAYDSTDVTRQNLVPRLEAKANELLERMKENNGGQVLKAYQPWRPLGETGVDEAWT